MNALAYAVKLLAGRDKSELKLRAALEKKAYQQPEIDETITRVKSLGYLEEARFAEAKVKEALRVGKTPADIRQRLEREGLTDQVIAATLEREVGASGFEPLAAARALLKKKKISGVKAARFLASRGFDEEIIRTVLPSLED